MLVMVQQEVGERLAADVGDQAYGAVSVKVAYWATARVVGVVPPTVFLPQPNVDSACVEIVRRPAPAPTRHVSGCSSSCGPASDSAARCSGGRWRRW
jgi:16S rRNA A1518/A1519 N6-dimethyltransferase RsmA/KsgA/DIM1 with predicted DNA glycosylase/AP lyase activity